MASWKEVQGVIRYVSRAHKSRRVFVAKGVFFEVAGTDDDPLAFSLDEQWHRCEGWYGRGWWMNSELMYWFWEPEKPEPLPETRWTSRNEATLRLPKRRRVRFQCGGDSSDENML